MHYEIHNISKSRKYIKYQNYQFKEQAPRHLVQVSTNLEIVQYINVRTSEIHNIVVK